MNALKIKAHELIDALPDDKIAKVLIILENVKDIINDALPDEWDLQLIKEAQEAEENGEFVSLDDVAKELGFNAGKLQGNH
jgi:DNA helicase IV